MPIDRLTGITERSSRTVTFTVTDNAGAAVPLSAITSAALTLYDVDTYVPGASPTVGIINGRDAQDVKNANNVTIHSTSGLVTWSMQPADNVIATSRRQVERHRAEFRFVVTGGVELEYQFEIEVTNLRKAS